MMPHYKVGDLVRVYSLGKESYARVYATRHAGTKVYIRQLPEIAKKGMLQQPKGIGMTWSEGACHFHRFQAQFMKPASQSEVVAAGYKTTFY